MASKRIFRIVAAYQTRAAGLRAREISERLASQMKSVCELRNDFWNFDLFKQRQLRRQASARAAEADMVIISVDRAAELPADVRNWIEDWLPERRTSWGVLVAQLNAAQSAVGQLRLLCAYLRKAAKKANMDFSCNLQEGWPEDSAVAADPVWPRPGRFPALREAICLPPDGAPGRG